MIKIRLTSLIALVSIALIHVNPRIGQAYEILQPTKGNMDDSNLIKAIKSNNQIAALRLIEKGINIDQPSTSGLRGTPLMYAVSVNNPTIVKALLAKGAEVNAVDITGDPAISWAAFSGNSKLISILLHAGANPYIRSKHGTSLDVVYRLWHSDSVAKVFRNYLLAKEQEKESELIQCVRNNELNKIENETILNTDLEDILGMPVLHIAVENHHNEIVKILLEKGANVNSTNRAGQTSLAWAARFGNKEAVKLLLENGANPNLADTTYQLHPLIGAAIQEDSEIVDLLVESGAKVNHADVINECAPIHWAIMYGEFDNVRFFLKHGADLQMTVLDDQYTALTLAQATQNSSIIKLINEFSIKKQLMGAWDISRIDYVYSDTTVSIPYEYSGGFILQKIGM